MSPLQITVNVSTTCPTCETYPLAVIDGHQVEECAYCYARTVRMLSETYGNFRLNDYAGQLDAAIEITVSEELGRL